MHRICKKYIRNNNATIASVVLGTLIFVIFLYVKSEYFSFDSSILQIDVRNYNYTATSIKKTSHKQSWPACKQNTSAAKVTGFSKFSPLIKDFLYYQHCRHFRMLLDIPDKCGGPGRSSEVFLLLVIKSSAANYDRREVLRKTWAKERQENGVWIRRLFISGTMGSGSERKKLNRLLKMEHRMNKDILQWDFQDSFYNLTLKQILFLEWMERNCPNARFLMNGDDDVFANTDNMVLYLQSLNGNNGSKHLFSGHLIYNVGPIRSFNSKYFIPKQVYASNSYPAYCGGGGFLLSGYTAMVIYNMSHSIPMLPIDDVYMGMCLKKAGLRPEHHVGVRTAGLNIPIENVESHDPCYFKEMLLVHRFLSVDMYLMWTRIKDPNLKCFVKNNKL